MRKKLAGHQGMGAHTTLGLANMDRAVKSTGPSIELGANTGSADSRDREFAPYQD
jgi:hypothetical protein